MPMMATGGTVRTQELPSTLRRSDREAQVTFAKAHDGAVSTYGEGQRAYRVAYAALKHKFEKRGDRWVKKAGKGPSDPRAREPQARRGRGETFGGVDVEGRSKRDLYEHAAHLAVQGRSKMSKRELAQAVARKQG